MTAFRLVSRPLGEVEHAADVYCRTIQAHQPADSFASEHVPAYRTCYLSWTGYFVASPQTWKPQFDFEPTAVLRLGTTSVICFQAEVFATNLTFDAEFYRTNRGSSITAVEVRTHVPAERSTSGEARNEAARILDEITALVEKSKKGPTRGRSR